MKSQLSFKKKTRQTFGELYVREHDSKRLVNVRDWSYYILYTSIKKTQTMYYNGTRVIENSYLNIS